MKLQIQGLDDVEPESYLLNSVVWLTHIKKWLKRVNKLGV